MPDTQTTQGRKFNYGNIVIAFLLGCSTILLFVGINKTTFRQMLNTVKQLSQPDAKIQLVNNIFREVVTLDQLQRNQTLQDQQKTYNPFTRESEHLQHMLDTLGAMSKGNNTQVRRIASMKNILHERDKLFLNYLLVRAKFNKNDTLIHQLQGLSNFITTNPQQFDSSLISTEKVVTTITTEHEDSSHPTEEKQGFWNRLFGKKKPKAQKQIEKLVKEELNIKLDTVAIGKKDSIIKELSKTVTIDQENRLKRRNTLIGGQQKLTTENSILIRQLLTILRDIEAEETVNAANKNADATAMINTDLDRMDAILVLFIVATAILVFFIIIDVNKSNRYRKQLILAKEEAEELGQVKQRFLANMSHELRTPLQTIIGMAEQMKTKGYSEKNELDIFYHSSQYLLQIVNEVLDYSRITSGRFRFDNKPFNMQNLLNDVSQAMQVRATQKQLQFSVRAAIDEQQNYIGDAFRLKQILYNLLGNAVKFTDAGSITLLVERNEGADNDTFLFTIQDTGSGIPEDKIENIFLEFETLNTPNLQRQNGTGLGLNIVKALVEGQEGNVSVSSTVGKGSTFTVTLSFAKTSEEEQQSYTEAALASAYEGVVWVVDDDVFILQLCATIFEKYHIRYKCFSLPEAVLNEPFDNSLTQVLLDIRLPGMSGTELCALLKKDSNFDCVIFTALTAQVMQDEKEQILNSGFDALLSKPFMEKDLVAAVVPHLQPVTELPEQRQQLNLAALYQMTGSDKELIQLALSNFIQETEKDINHLSAAILENDGERGADVLHRLASRCGQVGLAELLFQIRSEEARIRTGGITSGAESVLKGILHEIKRVVAEIKNYKEQLTD